MAVQEGSGTQLAEATTTFGVVGQFVGATAQSLVDHVEGISQGCPIRTRNDTPRRPEPKFAQPHWKHCQVASCISGLIVSGESS